MDKSASNRASEMAAPTIDVIAEVQKRKGFESREEAITFLNKTSVEERQKLSEELFSNDPKMQQEMKNLSNMLELNVKMIESKRSFLDKVKSWTWRHKWKLLLGALVVAGGATAAGYYYGPQIAAWAGSAATSISAGLKGWALKWLGIAAPAVPGVEISGVPEVPGGDAAMPSPESGPMPREIPSIPDSPAPVEDIPG